MRTLELGHWRSLHSYLKTSFHPFDIIIQLSLETGARPSEVVGLSASWLDGDFVLISGLKGSNDRRAPVSPSLAAKIEKVGTGIPDLFSAVSTAQGASSRRRLIHRRLQYITGRLFLPACGMRTLRHTICSQLYKNTKDILLVKDFIGHKALSSTLQYMHLENRERAADTVKELLA